MVSSPLGSRSKLTPLQEELLEAFFAREQRFFLTGGAALAGFYFGTLAPVRTFPDFRRRLASRGDERCIVDLVVDRAPMVEPRRRSGPSGWTACGRSPPTRSR